MTPTMEAPAPPAGGGGFDLDARMDSAFSAAPEAPAEEPIADVSQDPPEPPEAPAEDPNPLADDQPIVDEDGETDEQFTDDKNRTYYRVQPDRMKTFVNAKNFMRQMADIAPTIEDAKAHYQTASDFRALQSDFSSGEPEGVGRFVEYWAQGAPEGFQAMAENIPQQLAKMAANDPGALRALDAIEGQVQRAYHNRALAGDQSALKAIHTNSQILVNRAYQEAIGKNDAQAFYRAQLFDLGVNGKYLTDPKEFRAATAPQRQAPDPSAQLRERQTQLDQREQQFADQRWQEFDKNAIGGAKESALQGAVDAAFKVAEAAFTPGLLRAAKRDAMEQINAELAKQMEWSRNQLVEQKEIQREFLRAVRAGSKTELEPRAAALVQDYKARIARVLPGVVKPLIGEATQKRVQQSQAQHTRLQQGATKSAPGAGGRPAPHSIAPRQPKQSVGDRLDQLFG